MPQIGSTPSMERRGFLRLFGIGIPSMVALSGLKPLADLAETITYNPAQEIVPAGASLVGLEELTREFLRILGGELKYAKELAVTNQGYYLGTHLILGGGRSALAAEQCNAGLRHRLDEPMSVEGHIVPMAVQMARDIERKKINRFGTMVVPRGIAEGCVISSMSSGLSVRGLRTFDIDAIDPSRDGDVITRFDVLGAAA